MQIRNKQRADPGRWARWAVATVLAGGLFAAYGAGAASGPFEGWAGTWRGDGTITMANGSAERLRCRADVSQRDPNHFQQRLRCASDTYRVLVDASVDHSAGRISGNWRDANSGMSGNVSGRLRGDRIDAVIQGSGVAAEIVMTSRGNQRSFVIQPRETRVNAIQVMLSKAAN